MSREVWMGTTEQSRDSDIVARVNGVVGRLKWRVKAQAALKLGLIAGAVGLTLFALAIALTKFRLVDPSTPLYAGIGALALAAIGLIVGLARRLDDIQLAASLDAAASLQSRLGTALAFARLEQPTEMQRLAMEDALTVLDQAEPKRAAPWVFTPFIAGLVALAVALALNMPALWLLDPRVPAGSVGMLSRIAVPAPFQRQVVVLAAEDKKTLEVLAEDLEEPQAATSDPKVKEALADLNELIRALQEGRITAEDAHARLAELEKALDEWEAQDKEQRKAEDKIAEAARNANKTIQKTEPTLAEALSELQKRELEEAARRLEELQKKLDRGELDKKTQEKLAKDLAELAKGLKTERQKEKDRLQKEKDRLKEKERKEKDRFAQKDKDRLKDIERQLESFDQDQPPANEAQRQLERFSDDLDEAAQDLMRRLSEKMGPLDMPQQEDGPEDIARREREQSGQQGQDGDPGQEGQEGQAKSGDGDDLTEEELEQAAKALKRMAKRASGRQQMRSAGGRMVDLKEMLRRAAKQGQGDDSQEAFEKSAQGQGQDGRDGKDGKDGQGQAGGQKPGGKGGDMMLLGGSGQAGQGGAKIPGKGQGGQSGQANDGLGDGIGEGHDRNLVGEKTGMDVKTVEDFVEGKANDGPSQTRVIMAAAGRGFASRAYRDVHQDYAGVVEDNLEKEQIPAGKRSYVRRYFDLIRPR